MLHNIDDDYDLIAVVVPINRRPRTKLGNTNQVTLPISDDEELIRNVPNIQENI